MGRIYSEALNVIIWLGPEDSETPLVYGLIEDVSKKVWSRMHSFPLASYHEQTNLRDNVDSKLRLSSECTTWVAFRKWFSNPYFSRTWTVQEVVLARLVYVWCGSFRTSWSKLSIVCEVTRLFDRQERDDLAHLKGTEESINFLVMAQLAMKHTAQLYHEDVRSTFNLRMCSEVRCTGKRPLVRTKFMAH